MLPPCAVWWTTCVRIWRAAGQGAAMPNTAPGAMPTALECMQTVRVPGEVFGLCLLSDGDLIAACDAAGAGVFTRAPGRAAPAAAQKSLATEADAIATPATSAASAAGAAGAAGAADTAGAADAADAAHASAEINKCVRRS